jgi:hypothetical protein
MTMSRAEIAAAPRHPQLMDPAKDPEELIEASIWWYPSLYGNRTDVIQSLLLEAGNGYGWNDAGQICSVFAHIQPDYHTLAELQTRYDPDDPSGDFAAFMRESRSRELQTHEQIRATAAERARTHGRVTTSRGRGGWGLMLMRPERVHPQWQAVLDEAGQMFARAQAVQDAAVTRLRQQWDRNPAARAAQLLTRQLGRALAADRISDAELETCDRLLEAWRRPAWPARLDRSSLRSKRDQNREATRRIRAMLADDQSLPAAGDTAHPATVSSEPRPAADVLLSLATDRLTTLAHRVRPVPFTAWQEWDWTRDLVQEQFQPGTGQERGHAAATADFNSVAGRYKAVPLSDGIAGPWGHKVLREDGSLAGYAGFVSWGGDEIRVYSAAGKDLGMAVPGLAGACERLAARGAALDDETVMTGVLHVRAGRETANCGCEPEL